MGRQNHRLTAECCEDLFTGQQTEGSFARNRSWRISTASARAIVARRRCHTRTRPVAIPTGVERIFQTFTTRANPSHDSLPSVRSYRGTCRALFSSRERVRHSNIAFPITCPSRIESMFVPNDHRALVDTKTGKRLPARV